MYFLLNGTPSKLLIYRVEFSIFIQLSVDYQLHRTSLHIFHSTIGQSVGKDKSPFVSTFQISFISNESWGTSALLIDVILNTLFALSMRTSFSYPQTTNIAF